MRCDCTYLGKFVNFFSKFICSMIVNLLVSPHDMVYLLVLFGKNPNADMKEKFPSNLLDYVSVRLSFL